MSDGFTMDRWRGRTALVTGASSGIGAAVARRLAASGMKVALTARREDRLLALAEEITAEHAAARILCHPCDLRELATLDGLFAAVRERFGGVDVMVNNAGLGRNAPLMSGADEAWREMLEVNVLALCACTRRAVEDMRSRGDQGHVVHIASMAGHRVPEEGGAYAATKYAVRALTEGLRRELWAAKSAIRVSAVSPGFVETEFAAVYHGDTERARETYTRFPVLRPDDVAESVCHVLSAPQRMQIHDILVRPTEQPT